MVAPPPQLFFPRPIVGWLSLSIAQALTDKKDVAKKEAALAAIAAFLEQGAVTAVEPTLLDCSAGGVFPTLLDGFADKAKTVQCVPSLQLFPVWLWLTISIVNLQDRDRLRPRLARAGHEPLGHWTHSPHPP